MGLGLPDTFISSMASQPRAQNAPQSSDDDSSRYTTTSDGTQPGLPFPGKTDEEILNSHPGYDKVAVLMISWDDDGVEDEYAASHDGEVCAFTQFTYIAVLMFAHRLRRFVVLYKILVTRLRR